MTVSGWLFDAYPLNDKMVFWIKQEKENAATIRLEDDVWTHSIYAASDDKTLRYLGNTSDSMNDVITVILNKALQTPGSPSLHRHK